MKAVGKGAYMLGRIRLLNKVTADLVPGSYRLPPGWVRDAHRMSNETNGG